MADGPGVDVLEDDPQAEETPKDSAAMRQAWRVEAERAAAYFSAIPGFGATVADVRPTRAIPPAPAAPDAADAADAADADPERAETTVAPAREVTAVAQEKEGQLPRRRVLSRLRDRLGRHPHTQPAPPAPAEEPVLADDAPSDESRATHFHSSF